MSTECEVVTYFYFVLGINLANSIPTLAFSHNKTNFGINLDLIQPGQVKLDIMQYFQHQIITK